MKNATDLFDVLAALDYSNLLYAKGRPHKCLSSLTRDFIYDYKFEYLSAGAFRRVFICPKKKHVIKINLLNNYCGVDLAMMGNAEVNNYNNYAQAVWDASKGKIRFADTAHISPNITLQEFVPGEHENDSDYRVEPRLEKLMEKIDCPVSDLHDENWKRAKNGTIVILDLASGGFDEYEECEE